MMEAQEFQAQLEKLNDKLFAFALKLTRNEHNARDLYQETVTKAFRNRASFREGSNFKSWITTILYNTYLSDYRKRKFRKTFSTAGNEIIMHLDKKTAVKNKAVSGFVYQNIKRCINNLKDKYQIPFEMFCQGYQYNEIAESMKIPVGTVKSRISYARGLMKTNLRSIYGENFRRA